MSRIRFFDHVGITVRDLDTVTAFFVGLGFEADGRLWRASSWTPSLGCPTPEPRSSCCDRQMEGPGSSCRGSPAQAVSRDHPNQCTTNWDFAI